MAIYEYMDELDPEQSDDEDRLLREQLGGGGGSASTRQGLPTEFVSGLAEGANQMINTDGYAKPQFMASDFGNAPSGWDATKWADPTHQTPKYVVGRIVNAGDRTTEEGRAAILQQIQQAYPDAVLSGRDKLTIPSLGLTDIDIYGKSAEGIYAPTWQDPRDAGGGGPRPQGYYGTGDAARVGAVGASLAPDDWGSYKRLQDRLAELLGGYGNLDREALLAQMLR